MLKYLKIHWIGCLYSILLIGFTVYMFMDTFLISKVYRLEEKTEGQNIIQEKSRSGEEQATSETEAEICSRYIAFFIQVSENSLCTKQLRKKCNGKDIGNGCPGKCRISY